MREALVVELSQADCSKGVAVGCQEVVPHV